MQRVFLIDSFEVVRIGLRQSLTGILGYTVVGESHNPVDLPKQVALLQPDLIISEVMFPDGNSFRAMACLIKQNPALKVVFLTGLTQTSYAMHARKCGSYALIHKSQKLDEILFTIAQAAQGIKSFCLHEANPEGYRLSCQLSGREEEVVCCLAQGMRVKEMALCLGVSQKTIEAHKTNIMKKLDLHSQVDLIRWAVSEGLILP